MDELYDLVGDPYELNNLIDDPDYEETRAHFRQRLLYWAEKTDDELALWIRNLFSERKHTLLEDYEPYRH
jgi:hypothetical protein